MCIDVYSTIEDIKTRCGVYSDFQRCTAPSDAMFAFILNDY